MGRMCAFYEYPAATGAASEAGLDGGEERHLYVHYRSAYNRRWLLGFNGRRKRLSQSPEGNKVSFPRAMNAKKRAIREDRCDFLFSTGAYERAPVKTEWRGLFDHVIHGAGGRDRNRGVSGGIIAEVATEIREGLQKGESLLADTLGLSGGGSAAAAKAQTRKHEKSNNNHDDDDLLDTDRQNFKSDDHPQTTKRLHQQETEISRNEQPDRDRGSSSNPVSKKSQQQQQGRDTSGNSAKNSNVRQRRKRRRKWRRKKAKSPKAAPSLS